MTWYPASLVCAFTMDSANNSGISDILLHRQRRDLSLNSIKSFYDDKNNFAMYLVLPLIVIVYGSCAVIYCCARCRRYVKRNQRKSLKKGDPNETELIDCVSLPITSSEHMTREGTFTTTDTLISLEQLETGLPWQVQGESTLVQVTSGRTALAVACGATSEPAENAFHSNVFADDCNNNEEHNSLHSPPINENNYKSNRPISKPPLYEKNSVRERRSSVEEIITLVKAIAQESDLKERKRRQFDFRSSFRKHIKGPIETGTQFDEEKLKARQLARDNALRRFRQTFPTYRARIQPLQLQNKQSHKITTKVHRVIMAKQAATFLRTDYMGKVAGKKPKKLVSVTE